MLLSVDKLLLIMARSPSGWEGIERPLLGPDEEGNEAKSAIRA